MITQWHEIDGWFKREEAIELIVECSKVPRSGTVVELGSYKGRSTAVLARQAKERDLKLYAIDRWQKTRWVEPEQVFAGGRHDDGGEYMGEFIDNLRDLGLLQYVMPVCMLTTQAAMAFNDDSVHMIFHDASHDYESVKRDMDAWSPKLVAGGLWVQHDIDRTGGKAAFENATLIHLRSPTRQLGVFQKAARE